MASHNESVAAASQDGYKRVQVRITGKLNSQKGLHVDLGSSAMRCVYFYNYGDHMLNHMIVQNDPGLIDRVEGIEGREMEHAVDIYPFADGTPDQAIYPGNVPYHNRRPISAKYAFYPLVGMTDEMFQQYHLAKEIHLQAERDPDFKNRLEQGIDALLSTVFERAKDVICHWGDGSNKGIDTMTATVPAQWTIEFEKYYGERLHQAFLKVFEYPVQNILFHTEAQAALPNLGFATKHRPIKIETLARYNAARRSWLFAHRSAQGLGVYSMKCPRKACRHAFKQNPLLENRARDHFQQCGHMFDDDLTMLQECAQQVVNPSNDRRFTIDWMRNVYNASIIKNSTDKPRLEMENFPPPIL